MQISHATHSQNYNLILYKINFKYLCLMVCVNNWKYMDIYIYILTITYLDGCVYIFFA